MSYYRQRKSRLNKPAQQTAKAYTFPASVGGINALQALIAMPPEDCIYTDNLMPSEYGLRLRKGYSEWASGVDGDVRTIIPFEGQSADVNQDRMWAVSENGIYDVSLHNTQNPVPVVNFSVQGIEAGYGISTEFTNDASERYLMYADAQNGLHRYEEGVGWDIPTITSEDTTFDVTKVAFVMAWKNRLWFVMQNAGDAWYLPPDAIQGVVEKFTFGSKFTHGGELMGLYNWTIDGGDGVDDFLVAISRGGDVLIYHGTDPILPDFGLRGSWFIGEIPDSRNVTTSYGGDLYVLSIYGITSMRDLLQGTDSSSKIGSPSAKISRFLRKDVQLQKSAHNWALTINPSDGFLQVIAPFDQQGIAYQYTQNLLTQAWGRWTNVPANCAAPWSGEYFFGTTDGSVFIYDEVLDGTLLDGTPGQPVSFQVMTSFQAPENHATHKRVSIIRPIGILAGTASINVKAVFDYNVLETLTEPPPLGLGEGATWDDPDSNWDEDFWDFSLTGAQLPIGALGAGRAYAVAMRGSSSTRLTLLGWDTMYTSGDIL